MAEPLRAAAFDPGGTTGWAFAAESDDQKKVAIAVGQGSYSCLEMHVMLQQRVQHNHVTHVIYEDFQYRNYARMGLDLTPVKIIGIIELCRDMYEPNVNFYKQSAATGKAFYADYRLKDMGLYVEGMPHGRDALRHLLQWMNFGAGAQYARLSEREVFLV